MQAQELYLLLKLLCALGKVRGRTTAQKVFYLLQAHGYPTHLEYFLHYYGPYSEDLSSFLSSACLSRPPWLNESRKQIQNALRFDYKVTDEARNLVGALETKVVSKDLARCAEKFSGIARFLASRPAASLELAATILYLQCERGYQRGQAIEKTKVIKSGKATNAALAAATALLEELARLAA